MPTLAMAREALTLTPPAGQVAAHADRGDQQTQELEKTAEFVEHVSIRYPGRRSGWRGIFYCQIVAPILRTGPGPGPAEGGTRAGGENRSPERINVLDNRVRGG